MEYFVYEVNANSSLQELSDGEKVKTSSSALYDQTGRRKYLTSKERNSFLKAARALPDYERTFCLTLAYTGARISELLQLSSRHIDRSARCVIIETLKRRRRAIFRAVPVPNDLILELERIHKLGSLHPDTTPSNELLWHWCRTTAWNRVKKCMAAAEIIGAQATPKGLRHGFAVAALQSGVPINFVRKWLGHARLSTTEIYADASGDEERSIAQRFWETF